MSNSYRIRTKVGVDQSIKLQLDQEYDFLEILSLKIVPSQVYLRNCADYGVVVGRVSVNNGFGVPNARVSVFIPITAEDENNPVISVLYPYKTPSDTNAQGVKYNLLPSTPSYDGHNASGTFPTRLQSLTIPSYIEVFDKYYKYTVRTNDSGDFMIFGVPVGTQTLVMNVDLSDIGPFSLTPHDLIRMGKATAGQLNGSQFKSSTNLDSLPQIVQMVRNIEVQPLWGENDICNVGINRADFDLGKQGITIEPTATFMGSIFTDIDEKFMKANCKPNKESGELCQLKTGPGEILAIRQTIYSDSNGRPILEQAQLPEGGKLIDENGTWMFDLPMNLDYVVTNEYGEQEISLDPKKGVPTKGKYRFKIKWNQSPSLSKPIKRGYFLVPNIKEYGWDESSLSTDPFTLSTSSSKYQEMQSSYAFSLDWNQYGNTGTTVGRQMIDEAIKCEDRFYNFQYSKVYTVSQLISQFRKGYDSAQIVSIKNILDSTCKSENETPPVNDAFKKFDLMYLLYQILAFFIRILSFPLVIVTHVLSFIIKYLLIPVLVLIAAFATYQAALEFVAMFGAIAGSASFGATVGLIFPFLLKGFGWLAVVATAGLLIKEADKVKDLFKEIKLPNLTYPDCQFCDCSESGTPGDDGSPVQPVAPGGGGVANVPPQNSDGSGLLAKLTLSSSYYRNPSGPTELFAGKNYPQQGTVYSNTLTPDLIDAFESGSYWFTSNLTLPERIDLFNTKAKYFDLATTIGGAPPITSGQVGQGVNQIKVIFATDLNPITSHFDNVVAVIFDQNSTGSLSAGQMLAFQKETSSKDPNYKNVDTNVYGIDSITGTPLLQSATTTSVSVSYANPNGSGNVSVNYLLTGNTTDGSGIYAKFPIDVEYFQVITAMTVTDYLSMVSSTPLDNSFPARFLNNDIDFLYINSGNCMTAFTESPLTQFMDYNKQYVTFMVRGVDPNSNRYQNEYDLSILFGYNSWGNVKVSGKYKLNIPIQGKYLAVSHSNITNNNTVDTYSNEKLFYSSYMFLPGSGMSAFTSALPSYYVLNDKNILTTLLGNFPAAGFGSNTYGLVVGAGNYMTVDWNVLNSSACNYYTYSVNSGFNSKGYLVGEPVEGGSCIAQLSTVIGPPANPRTLTNNSTFNAQKYSNSISFVKSTSSTSNNIVMRSDRLPMSTMLYYAASSYYPLQENSVFSVYNVSDDGYVNGNASTSTNNSSANSANNADEPPTNPLLNSFSCGSLVPLSCYEDLNGAIIISPDGSPCYKTSQGVNYMKDKSCYQLVTTLFLSIPDDFKIVNEWLGRSLTNFALCRNVVSHTFTNSWINGSLYLPALKNNRFFTLQNGSLVGESLYCTKTAVLSNQTNTFYYRSSPWSLQNNFVGQPAQLNSLNQVYGGNKRNLMFPTTIMDLGPRVSYLKQIIYSKDYNGYVVDKLDPTSYQDVSEILNYFVISRLTNNTFLQNLIAGNVGNFFSRSQGNDFINMVDGDYAQLISINSELGVVPYEPANYTDPADTYYNGGTSKDGVIGIFFSSYTQTRDWVTPKRDILNPNASISNFGCSFDNFPVKSQLVPFYQWEVKSNPDKDSIFGSQQNDWYTGPINGNGFFSFEYQSLDRIGSGSRYPQPYDTSKTSYFKGYIYNVNNGKINPNYPAGNYKVFTTGNPFFFYFGLKKGKTAFDRFYTAWIQTDKTTE